MSKVMLNRTHIEGILYEHDLEIKTSGPNTKAPGTQFISGNISIATDDAVTNIIPVHFTYVTATTKNGGTNATYTTLNSIINGTLGTYMKDGKDKACKLRIDSAIGLNEFYSDRNGTDELVSTKRNEGGFVHTTNELNKDEKQRDTFECDMLITGAIHVEANEERNAPEKVTVKGFVFDFRKALLPVEFSALNKNAMNYFEDLNASLNNPVLTKVWGHQVSETVVRTIEEESAFGDPSVREVRSTRRDFVITGAAKEPYVWDDESTMTVVELKEAQANREIYLAGIKQRRDEYRAAQGAAPSMAATFANNDFNF